MAAPIEIADAAGLRGVEFVDCPISGGPEAARKAALSVMLSGPREAIETIKTHKKRKENHSAIQKLGRL